ncbi:MAG: hypothetical protein KTR24_01565 [Saprospiraceae bacterium]|nr:hypothetical protein [Saprospiraceae bacterium]
MKQISFLQSLDQLQDTNEDVSQSSSTLCILEHHHYVAIHRCASWGIPVLTPNPFMTADLTVKTIIKMKKSLVILSERLYQILQLHLQPLLSDQGLRIMIIRP